MHQSFPTLYDERFELRFKMSDTALKYPHIHKRLYGLYADLLYEADPDQASGPWTFEALIDQLNALVMSGLFDPPSDSVTP